MINNPILKGFCPDPSVIRNGDDYFIATSTFEWWPGVRIFHSKNLVDFDQIPSPLRRYSQLDMTGDGPSCGVWAPDLTFDGKRYFLTYTDVKTKKYFYNTHNYLVYTDDIYGEWSEPVYLNSIGFDPSLLHDNDGNKYLVSMLNGFKGITIQKLDPDTYEPVGERRLIYQGSGIGCTEGPHLYHINDYYYLVTAEGGTGYDHCVTLARSRDIYGPYETAPDNPIITSDKTEGIQKCGHGDLVISPQGKIYMVHLCSRPVRDTGCVLGRETAVQELEWKDGWLRLKGGCRYAASSLESVNGISHAANDGESLLFEDDFSLGDIRNEYVSPRRDYKEFACIKRAEERPGLHKDDGVSGLHKSEERPGLAKNEIGSGLTKNDGSFALHIKGQESFNSFHRVSLLAVRQEEFSCLVRADMKYLPTDPERMAGLAYMYDALNCYMWVRTLDDDGRDTLKLIKSDKGVITTEESISLEWPESISLYIRTVEGREVYFGYGADAEVHAEVHYLEKPYTTAILNDEYCRGFTGCQFGMYAHDLTGLGYGAEFDYFSVTKTDNI